ncbi:MAG: hypothetical protein JNL82_35880 [Myxococcales bacterium]|nr:hypothetical protein [Myxococcales bacterium]
MSNLPAILRSVVAVVAGLLVFFVVVMVVQGAMAQVYPLPAGVDVRDMEAIGRAVLAMPAGAFGLLLAGYAIGALCGGMVAAASAARAEMRHAIIVGAVTTLGGVANFVMLPHPTWVVLLGLPLFLIMAAIGGRIGVALTRR